MGRGGERGIGPGAALRPAALRNGDIVDDMLHVIGAEDIAPSLERVQVNEAISMLGLHLLDAAWRAGERPNAAVQRIFEAVPGPRYVLPERALDMAAARAEPQLAWLREMCGIELQTPVHRPVEPPRASPEELDAMARVLLEAGTFAARTHRSIPGRAWNLSSPFAQISDRPDLGLRLARKARARLRRA